MTHKAAKVITEILWSWTSTSAVYTLISAYSDIEETMLAIEILPFINVRLGSFMGMPSEMGV